MVVNAVKWNADLYDNKHDFVFKYGEDLVELLHPLEAEKILDVGCGTGYLTHLIAEKGADVLGIDSSDDMVKKAQQTYPLVSFQTADITQFQSNIAFDAVFSNAVLHWVLQAPQAAQQMYQTLKKGGRLVLEMGGKANVQMITDALKQVLVNRGYVSNAERRLWYFPSVGEYTTVLENAGFRVVYATHYNRETALKDDGNGISDWIRMFGSYFLKDIQKEEAKQISLQVQEQLRATHFRDGRWYADYKRLRVVAIKE